MEQEKTKTKTNPFTQLAAIQANDEKVLAELYRDNYKRVENFILQNNGTADEAKDIYQETFIAVWRNIQLSRFVPTGETALSGYIYQIAKNKWLDYLRSGHYKNTLRIASDFSHLQSEEVSEDDHLDISAIADKFALLGENCREVLKRFYFRKEPMREIARLFNWTEATTRNNKYRCLQQLRKLVEK